MRLPLADIRDRRLVADQRLPSTLRAASSSEARSRLFPIDEVSRARQHVLYCEIKMTVDLPTRVAEFLV